MEKIIKSYVEKQHYGYVEPLIKEVAERDPMQVENDGSIQRFRFYDKEIIIDGSTVCKDEISNYSNWVCFGKRLSLNEIKNKCRILIANMEENGSQYFCYTQDGSFFQMEEGDMTFDELVAQKKHDKEKSDNALEKDKYTLMKEGAFLVKPETIEDWLGFVDNNDNDESSALIVKATISMMKKFEEGLSFEEAEQQVYNEELELNEVMTAATASAISHFAKKGEEYRDYWYKKYGIATSEINETVNPNMLKK